MNVEKGGPPIAIGALAVIDGPAPTLDEYRESVAGRIAGKMRQRLVPDPLRVRQPEWEDAEPDLTRQIRELAVPAPGGQDELQDAVAQIMAVPMDHELPLWDSTLITGLPEDAWAAVIRVHHSVADGQGSLLLTGRLIDVDPEGTKSLTAALDQMMSAGVASRLASEEEGEKASTTARLAEATQKGGDLLLRAMRTLTSASATGEAVTAATNAASKALDALGSQLPQSPGPLAGDPGKDRAWVMTQVSMADVKTIRSTLGGTVNDVVMTLMSGGLARAIAKMGLDADVVRVMIPLSLRTPGDLTSNNQVSALLVVLPLGGSATERLADIRAHIDAVKDLNTGAAGSTAQNIIDRTVPAFVQTFAVSNLAGRLSGAFSETLVTNVPGPQFPIYVMGRHVNVLAPIIPLGEPLRLSTGIMSLNGTLHFGISGGEGVTDAVAEVASGVQETLASLLQAARGA